MGLAGGLLNRLLVKSLCFPCLVEAPTLTSKWLAPIVFRLHPMEVLSMYARVPDWGLELSLGSLRAQKAGHIK